ncbi:iron-containing alcohol dehydrogenase [Salmonella enterica subsp. enterica]|nr:iron-containing alcohol dehydrogenase [Salmonella enterica subsp. enterica]
MPPNGSSICPRRKRRPQRRAFYQCSTLAGWHSAAGLGLNHAIVHQLGGQFHLPHGPANAPLLTTAIRFYPRVTRAPPNVVTRGMPKLGTPLAVASDVAAINALIQQTNRASNAAPLPLTGSRCA